MVVFSPQIPKMSAIFLAGQELAQGHSIGQIDAGQVFYTCTCQSIRCQHIPTGQAQLCVKTLLFDRRFKLVTTSLFTVCAKPGHSSIVRNRHHNCKN